MKKSKGFTLVELMVVIVIIGILAALAIPKLLGATSKAKLSEFKSVLKSVYTLQESHFQEAGIYTTDKSAIGFSTPGGKSNFDYGLLDPTANTGLIGTASSKTNVSIKLSDGTYIGGTTGTPEAVACVDTSGVQFGKKLQIAQDAGLSAQAGVTTNVASGYYVNGGCVVATP